MHTLKKQCYKTYYKEQPVVLLPSSLILNCSSFFSESLSKSCPISAPSISRVIVSVVIVNVRERETLRLSLKAECEVMLVVFSPAEMSLF